MKKRYNLYILIFSIVLLACEDNLLDGITSIPTDPPAVPATAGNADFSKYIALGNSLTAGFMDGALYSRGQAFSFPAQLHSSISRIEGADSNIGVFNQPDINAENGFFGTLGSTILGRLKLNSSSLPEPTLPGQFPDIYNGDRSQLNNFGVPGIALGQMLSPDTGNPDSPLFNLLYARFATQPGQSTILGDAIATSPTFYTLWIGNNDVLGYAVSGATREDIFTDPITFEALYTQVLQPLVATGAKGIVANIPNVTDIPFFNTIPNNAFVLTSQGQVDSLNMSYAIYNTFASTAGRDIIEFQLGANLMIIEDESVAEIPGLPQIRQMKADELVTLTIPQSSIPSWHIPVPVFDTLMDMNGMDSLALVNIDYSELGIPDQYILTSDEIAVIAQRVADFNSIIANLVSTLGGDDTGLIDMNTIFNNFALNGVASYYGVTIDPTITPPFGAFSLDGVHPNAKGHAFVANQFIEAINKKFNATLPFVGLEIPPGNDFPQ